MSGFMLNWDIEERDAGKILREFLKEKNISKAALTDIKFHGGKILVQDKEVTVRYELKSGDQVTIYFPVENISESMLPEEIPLEIVFEDNAVLVLNKPAGMNTIPSREHPDGSLANALLGYYQRKDLLSTIHIVTRLDRDTSGLVLVAKHRHVHHLLSEDQKNGRVHRKYEALVAGIMKDSGVVEAPIGRKEDSIIEREVRSDGQYAYTTYQAVKSYKQMTHVKLMLLTGRTHQIRVHMAYIGHPLLGDTLYGGTKDSIDRQALHCYELSFTHPVTGEVITLKASRPDDMQKCLDQWERA